MKLFFRYLMQKRRVIFVFALFSLIFTVSFWLYRLPVAAVVYPAVLCAALGLVLLAMDFRREYAKHEKLERIRSMNGSRMKSATS